MGIPIFYSITSGVLLRLHTIYDSHTQNLLVFLDLPACLVKFMNPLHSLLCCRFSHLTACICRQLDQINKMEQ